MDIETVVSILFYLLLSEISNRLPFARIHQRAITILKFPMTASTQLSFSNDFIAAKNGLRLTHTDDHVLRHSSESVRPSDFALVTP
jgi:hypothetical protein